MLVLSRKPNESIDLSGEIVVKVLRIHGGKVVLGIEAPDDVTIRRREVGEEDREEAAA